MATICFVCEGAYPYVVGGVSAWVHELITSNPQHDFKILCIIPDEKFAKLKYQIPKNVVEIKNIFMDSSLDFSYSSFIKAGLQENEEKKVERQKLVRTLKHFSIEIEGFRDISEAIITSGGINVKEINPKTMESKLIKNLYFAGEIIDVDAYTGGFNLQIAYSTGYTAGIGVNSD